MSVTYPNIEHWNMADFSNNLIEIRKERGLTQQELADLLVIQPRLVGRWEQGKGKPQFDYILRLADVLEVSIDRLLRGQTGLPPSQFDIRNKKLKELCQKVDKLKPEDQEIICHFLDMAVRHEKLKGIMDSTH
ncbi:helix-turn-helix domain-containing protein [Pseudomonadota bacterium]